MLRFFAKLERSRSALLLAFCALLLVGLIAFYIPNSSLGPGAGAVRSSADDNVIAKVGSQEITLKEYKGALSNMLSAFSRGNSLPLGIAKSIGYDKRALDDLISERLVIEEGRELNLTGADREVADAIIRAFTNDQGKFVGRNEYLRRMKTSGLNVEEYENDRRNDITARKVREFIVSPIQVSDREVEEKYKRDSIIKLNVLAASDENTMKEKIDELARKVRGSKDAPAEDFATVAKGHSMDPSAKQGGDIGWIKEDKNRPGQWRQRVYTNDLEAGAIEGPFKDGRSWYLMKVTDKRDVPFDQMRDTLKATAQNNKAYKVANDLAQKAYEKATQYKDLRKAAEEVAGEIKVSADSLLKTTPYFKDGDEQKDLGDSAGHANNPAFDTATSAIAEGGIGEKVSIPGGFAVPRVVDILDNGAAMSFEQARNQVENKYRQEKEPTFAQARAQDILNQSKSVEDFERLAKAEGLETKTDTNFDNYSFPGASQGSSQAQARAALVSLKEGEAAKSPIKVGASYLIFAAKKRTEADLSKLPQEREGVRQGILSERQSLAYSAFIKAARKRYEEQGKIKIYQDRIDKFFKAAEAAQDEQQ